MDALRSRTVNLTALARRVEKAHFPDLTAIPETTGESLSVPVTCMKHVISFQTLHQQSILMMRLSQSQLFHLVRYYAQRVYQFVKNNFHLDQSPFKLVDSSFLQHFKFLLQFFNAFFDLSFVVHWKKAH